MKAKAMALTLALAMFTGIAAGCGEKETSKSSSSVPVEPVTLTISGGWEDCRALEEIGRLFTEKHPNCTISYEYLQDYSESLEKRLGGEEPFDLFVTTNIQSDSALLPYALDLNSCEGLDLSDTFPGLIENFTFRGDSEGGQKLYAIPLGSEMRGLYVNKTLLSSLGIEVPTNQAETLAACEILKQNGYTPFHGNPGNFGQTLIYPWICNIIVNSENSEAIRSTVAARGEGFSEIFREPFEFLYKLVENNYYDYKSIQNDPGLFIDITDENMSRDFLNILAKGDSFEKIDDIGQVAFMPGAISLGNVIEKVKSDYHSNIEYIFVPAPIGPDGGYVYLSPAHGIAANKNSANLEWSVKFLDFLFTPENNAKFAELFNIMPNTAEVFTYAGSLYNVPANHISQLGQVTFEYEFYTLINDNLIDLSKGNNPKYMQVNEDDSLSLYPLEYYLGNLEESVKGDEE